MNRAALLVLGVGAGAAGLYFATRPAQASVPPEPAEDEPVIPDENIQFPEDLDPESGSGAPPEMGAPPAGSGAPEVLSEWEQEHMDSLPPILTNINLSGNERYEFVGERLIAGRPMVLWAVHDSINGFSISIVVDKVTPSNWVSVIHLPQSFTVHRINGDTQADRDWLSVNVLNQPAGSYSENTQ